MPTPGGSSGRSPLSRVIPRIGAVRARLTGMLPGAARPQSPSSSHRSTVALSSSSSSLTIMPPSTPTLSETMSSRRLFSSSIAAGAAPRTRYTPSAHGVYCPEEPHMLHPKDGPWGFFPMRIGQLLMDKYEIVRKLGYGAHASIWLAKIQKDHGYDYVVLKVMSINATLLEFIHETHETEVGQSFVALREADKEHPGYAHCAATSFMGSVHSKWGIHYVCLLQPYGTSLGALCAALPRRLPLPVVKRVVKQMLLALQFLHNRLHVVHADFRLDNILLKLHASTEHIDRFLRKYPAQTYPPIPEADPSSDTVLTVRSQPLPNLGLDPSLSNLEVCVSDYGNTVRADKINADTPVFTADQVVAPEQLLGHPWSYPVDVWALGVNTFLMLTGSDPFEHQNLALSPDAAQLACINARLGPFPAHFLQRCARAAEYFDADGNVLHPVSPSWGGPLEGRLRESLGGEATPRDVRDAWSFIRKCLPVDPAERPTVEELLADAWLAA
ncbi:kinase-like protein [Lenzites betulinus]|nr:kinase-like protein [Lenzites betulinus]